MDWSAEYIKGEQYEIKLECCLRDLESFKCHLSLSFIIRVMEKVIVDFCVLG